MALFDTAHQNLYVACTGDSRAVAGIYEETEDGKGSWRVEVLSEDQTGRNPNELKRYVFTRVCLQYTENTSQHAIGAPGRRGKHRDQPWTRPRRARAHPCLRRRSLQMAAGRPGNVSMHRLLLPFQH